MSVRDIPKLRLKGEFTVGDRDMFRTYIGTQNGVYKLYGDDLTFMGLEEHDFQAVHAFRNGSIGSVDTILAGSYGEGMFRSEDGGQNWEPANEGMTAPAMRTIVRDPTHENGILCGTEPGRAFRSSDGGASWQELEGLTETPTCPEWFLPYSPRAGALRNFYSPPGRANRLLASIEVGGLMDSQDGGETWTRQELFDDDIHHITGHPEDPDVLWMALGWAALKSRDVDRSPLGGLAVSEDGGETWIKVIERDYTRAVIVPPTLPNVVLASPAQQVGREGKIVASSDQGKTWEPAGNGVEDPMKDMIELFLDAPDGSVWALFAQGRLCRAEPGEWNWRSVLETTQSPNLQVESVCFVTDGEA